MSIARITALLALFILATAARAETIGAQWNGDGLGYHLTIQYDDDGAGPGAAGTVSNVPVGMYLWQPTNSSNIAPFNQWFATFCIDIDTAAQTNNFTLKTLEQAPTTNGPGAAGSGPTSTLMSAQQADYIRELWGENYSTLRTGTETDQNIKTAAFQLAIWEILFEESATKSLSGGYLKVVYSGSTPAYVTKANQFLTSTYDAGYSAIEKRLVALTSSYGQDHVAMVPLPPAVLGGLALMGGIAIRRRWANARDSA